MKNKILLQGKFILVHFVNLVYNLIPFFFLRKFFLSVIGIQLGNKSCIHRGVKLFHIGNLVIGNNSVINFNCFIDNRRKVEIGNNVSISHNTKIYTLGHSINSSDFCTQGKPVKIEDYVSIFANVLIMPGVTIGYGAVVLPGSVVTKSIGEMDVVGGNPAKFVKKRISTLEYKIDYDYWFAL